MKITKETKIIDLPKNFQSFTLSKDKKKYIIIKRTEAGIIGYTKPRNID